MNPMYHPKIKSHGDLKQCQCSIAHTNFGFVPLGVICDGMFEGNVSHYPKSTAKNKKVVKTPVSPGGDFVSFYNLFASIRVGKSRQVTAAQTWV